MATTHGAATPCYAAPILFNLLSSMRRHSVHRKLGDSSAFAGGAAHMTDSLEMQANWQQ